MGPRPVPGPARVAPAAGLRGDPARLQQAERRRDDSLWEVKLLSSDFFEELNDGATRREKIGTILIRNESDLIRVRDRVRLVARELGFDNITQIKLTTAVSELTRNIYEYAGTGSISVSLLEKDGRKGLEI